MFYDLCRHTYDDRACWHVSGCDRARANHSVLSHDDAGQQDGTHGNAGPVADDRSSGSFGSILDSTERIVVGRADESADKDASAHPRSRGEIDKLLESGPFTNDDTGLQDGIESNPAMRSEAAMLTNTRTIADKHLIADFDIIINRRSDSDLAALSQ